MVFLVVAVQESLAQERLIRFEQNERWGYKNSLGKVVIEPQFEIAEDFSAEGIAAVVDAKGWAYIDRKGNIVVRPFNYDNGPDTFQEGLARFVADDGKIGFFNKKGRPVIQPQFGSAFYFKEGLAAVCIKCREEVSGDARVIRGGKWGYINHKGEMVIKPQYDRAFPFEKGLAQVCLGCSEQTIGEHSIVTGGMWGSINKSGKVVVSFRDRTELPRRLRPMRFLNRCVRARWQRLPPTSNTRWYLYTAGGWKPEDDDSGWPDAFVELPLIGIETSPVDFVGQILWRSADPSSWKSPPRYLPIYRKKLIADELERKSGPFLRLEKRK